MFIFFQGEHSNSFLQALKLFSFSLLLIFTLCERACQNLMLSPFSSVHSSICTPPSLPSCSPAFCISHNFSTSVKSTFLKIPRIYDIMCGFPVSALFHLTWWSKFPFTLLWQIRYSTVCKPHGLYPSSRPGAPTCLPFCDCWPLSHCILSVKSTDLPSKSWLHLL